MNEATFDGGIDDILHRNRHIILEGIFGTRTPIQVESSMAFAKYLRHVGMNLDNFFLFLKIMETNNRWIVDELVGQKDPRLFFSAIKPNRHLAARAFELLSLWHPGQIYSKVLLAVLGVIEYCYHGPDEGYNIYKVDMMDLDSLGKFLKKK